MTLTAVKKRYVRMRFCVRRSLPPGDVCSMRTAIEDNSAEMMVSVKPKMAAEKTSTVTTGDFAGRMVHVSESVVLGIKTAKATSGVNGMASVRDVTAAEPTSTV